MRLLQSSNDLNRASGTSFHMDTFIATPQELEKLLGTPTYNNNDGEDKVNLEWVCETGDGDVFTIYDWKYYRPLSMTERVEWHIGGHNKHITTKAKHELEHELRETRG